MAQLAGTVDMSDDEDLSLTTVATGIICDYSPKHHSRYWALPSSKMGNENRKMLYKEMVFDHHISDSGSFRNFLYMCASGSEVLLSKIPPTITKENTNMRKAVRTRRSPACNTTVFGKRRIIS